MYAFVQEQVDRYMKQYKDDIRDKVVELDLVTSEPVVKLLQYVYDHKPTLVLPSLPSSTLGSNSSSHFNGNANYHDHVHSNTNNPNPNGTSFTAQQPHLTTAQQPSPPTTIIPPLPNPNPPRKRTKSQSSSSSSSASSMVYAHKRQPSTHRCTYTCPQSKKTCLKKKQGDSVYCKCHHQMMVSSKSSLSSSSSFGTRSLLTTTETMVPLFTEQIGGITYALDEYGNVYDMAHALKYHSIQVGTYEKDPIYGTYTIHLTSPLPLPLPLPTQ